ncbi:MAG: PqqD family protein [Acidobacteriota bacterium]|nr:PqqD family protein [Acidobacteriota bacterium]
MTGTEGAIDTGSVLRRRGDVRFRLVEDEAVVVRQSAAEVLVLNEVASRILALADGSGPVGTWVEALLGEYAVEREVLTRDVLAFAVELTAAGLLEPAPPAAGDDLGV